MVVKKWASIAEVQLMTRDVILDANDWADALEEAEDRQAERQAREQNRR